MPMTSFGAAVHLIPFLSNWERSVKQIHKAKGLEYIFLDIGFHLFGPAQYIFFASTLYLFGVDIPPDSQLYCKQQGRNATNRRRNI